MFGFKLNNTLSASSAADETDVLNMKSALQDLGEYEEPGYGVTPFPDTPMFEGMKRVQKKTGLTVDGIARPGGPTETTVNAGLARKEMERRGKPTSTGTHPERQGDDIQSTITRIKARQKQRASQPQSPAKTRPTAKARPTTQSQPVSLTGSVGGGRVNRPQDVVALKNALAWVGRYPADKARQADPRPDEDLTWGLHGFQRDFGLKQDGLSNPGGETETHLNTLITPMLQLVEGRKVNFSESRKCAPLLSQIKKKKSSLDRKRKVQEGYDRMLQDARANYAAAQETLETMINDLLENGEVFSQVCNWVPHKLGEIVCRVSLDAMPVAGAKAKVQAAAKAVEDRFEKASTHAETITDSVEQIEILEQKYDLCRNSAH